MEIKILMPSLSPTMSEGNISKWHVKIGQKVVSGEVLAEIETDKATMELENVDEGIISKLLYKEGDINIPVNTPIAILETDSKDEKKIIKKK